MGEHSVSILLDFHFIVIAGISLSEREQSGLLAQNHGIANCIGIEHVEDIRRSMSISALYQDTI